MNRRFSSTASLYFAVTFLLLGLFSWGCDDSSGGNPTGGDNPNNGTQCTPPNHDECEQAGGNWVCTSEGRCVDRGPCTSAAECQSWRTGYNDATCNSGLCSWGGEDGDDDSEVDQSASDGCKRLDYAFSGTYCGETATIYVTTTSEGVGEVYWLEEDLQGVVSEGCMVSFEGSECTGSILDGSLTLTCPSCDSGNIDIVAGDGGYLTIDPTAQDYGNVERNATKNNDFQLSASEADVTIAKIVFSSESSPNFTISNIDAWTGATISAGSYQNLTITYTCNFPESMSREAEEATIYIYSNDKIQQVYAISVWTTPKVDVNVVVEPVAINFGSSAVEYDNERMFQIKNIAGAPGQVTGIAIGEDAQGNLWDGEGAFTLMPFTPENEPPFVVEAGDVVSVYVNFHPIQGVHRSGVTYDGQILVTYLDSEEKTKEKYVSLIGRVEEVRPACLDIQPLEGSAGIWGMGEYPGPGINFGMSQIGVVSTRILSISNCGDLPLTINSIAWNQFGWGPPFTSPAFFEDIGTFHSYTLQRQDTIFLNINFLPLSESGTDPLMAAYSGQIIVTSDAQTGNNIPAGIPEGACDPSNGNADCSSLPGDCMCVNWGGENLCQCQNPQNVTVGVRGSGARRDIEVLPSKVEFGLITLGCKSRPEIITIYNLGDLPLDIEDIRIGNGSDDKFILKNLPTLPMQLGGSGNMQSVSFMAQFEPTFEGEHTGRVEIVSDDQDEQMYVVPLLGEGTTIAHQTDEFVQIDHPMVDLLWVVDHSGSMNDEQELLRDNFNTFISEAVTWDADMNVAMTTVDMEEAEGGDMGEFQGSPKIINFGAPDGSGMSANAAIEAFKDNSTEGSGGGTEKGLAAGHAALSPPMLTETEQNPGPNDIFIRDDAKLSIIFVSDEEDQSIPDTDFYVDFFKSKKGYRNVNLLEVYAIVGDPDPNGGCGDANSSTGASATAGNRYVEVADRCNPHSGEHFISVCDRDWGPVFSTIAENIFELRYQFPLSRWAEPDSIRVKVGHPPSIPMASLEVGWEYDDLDNSIIFDADNVPQPGDTIIVDYEAECYQ